MIHFRADMNILLMSIWLLLTLFCQLALSQTCPNSNFKVVNGNCLVKTPDTKTNVNVQIINSFFDTYFNHFQTNARKYCKNKGWEVADPDAGGFLLLL